jgi:polysaccharide export outer membrane protein
MRQTVVRAPRAGSVRLTLIGCLIPVLLLPATSAHGQAVAPEPAESMAPADAAPQLGPGDRVSIVIFGQPDLSGEHILDGQGNLSLPLGGKIGVTGLTAMQLERRITDVLADGYIRQPRVSVGVVELRPIFVMGDVRLAGAVAYRHGMNVLSAIALAGGHASAQMDAMGPRGQLLEAEERLDLMLAQRMALRARIARLIAQRDGVEAVTFPPELEKSSPVASQLLAGERSVFDSEREAQSRSIILLQRQEADAQAEAASIAEQIRLERQQLQSVASYVAELTRLARNGLTDRRRVVDMEREEARIEANLARLGTESMRAAQLIRDAPLRMTEIVARTKQRAAIGLQEANVRLTEVDSGIEAMRELIAVRRQQVGAAALARRGEPVLLLITRAAPDGARTFEAQETTALRPGDILRVGERTGSQLSSSAPTRP